MTSQTVKSSQWINVKAASGGEFGAYLSLPPAGKGPGLVMFQEIFGVNRHMRATAEQYARDAPEALLDRNAKREAARDVRDERPAEPRDAGHRHRERQQEDTESHAH